MDTADLKYFTLRSAICNNNFEGMSCDNYFTTTNFLSRVPDSSVNFKI